MCLPTKKLQNHLVIIATNQNLTATRLTKTCIKLWPINYFSSVPDLTLNNFNEIFKEFYRLISKTISQHAPLKRCLRRQRKLLKKPWITKGILTSIKKKSFMFKTHFLYGNASQKLFFKRYSNKLTKIKAMSKRSYFKSKLQNHQGDAKTTWEILRKLLPASGKTS